MNHKQIEYEEKPEHYRTEWTKSSSLRHKHIELEVERLQGDFRVTLDLTERIGKAKAYGKGTTA